jgi:hypothetical protein
MVPVRKKLRYLLLETVIDNPGFAGLRCFCLKRDEERGTIE